jgi:hypothetical protein
VLSEARRAVSLGRRQPSPDRREHLRIGGVVEPRTPVDVDAEVHHVGALAKVDQLRKNDRVWAREATAARRAPGDPSTPSRAMSARPNSNRAHQSPRSRHRTSVHQLGGRSERDLPAPSYNRVVSLDASGSDATPTTPAALTSSARLPARMRRSQGPMCGTLADTPWARTTASRWIV